MWGHSQSPPSQESSCGNWQCLPRDMPSSPDGQEKNRLFLPLEQLALVLAGFGSLGTGYYSLARVTLQPCISRRAVLLLIWSRHLLSSPQSCSYNNTSNRWSANPTTSWWNQSWCLGLKPSWQFSLCHWELGTRSLEPWGLVWLCLFLSLLNHFPFLT